MALTEAQAGLIDTGVNTAGNAVSTLVTLNQYKKNREFNAREAEKARQFQLDMWNRQNAYDSPAAKMQRYIDAGLNPNLVFGDIGSLGNPLPSAAQASGGSSGAVPSLSPNLDLVNAKLVKAQIDRLNTQNDNESRITKAQVDDIYGDTPYKKEVINNLIAKSNLINNQSDEVISQIDLNKADLDLKHIDLRIREVIYDSEKEKLKWLPDVMRATVYELYGRGAEHFSQVSLNSSQERVNSALITYYRALGNQADANTALLNLQKVINDEYGLDLAAAEIVDKTNKVVSTSFGVGSVRFSHSDTKQLSFKAPFKSSDIDSVKGNFYYLKDGSQYWNRDGIWFKYNPKIKRYRRI